MCIRVLASRTCGGQVAGKPAASTGSTQEAGGSALDGGADQEEEVGRGVLPARTWAPLAREAGGGAEERWLPLAARRGAGGRRGAVLVRVEVSAAGGGWKDDAGNDAEGQEGEGGQHLALAAREGRGAEGKGSNCVRLPPEEVVREAGAAVLQAAARRRQTEQVRGARGGTSSSSEAAAATAGGAQARQGWRRRGAGWGGVEVVVVSDEAGLEALRRRV
ncbi:hypothetical protein T484DRAFT_1882674, partial [Baffinella frigidus]